MDERIYVVKLSRENMKFLTFCMMYMVVNRPVGMPSDVIEKETADICPKFFKAMNNDRK